MFVVRYFVSLNVFSFVYKSPGTILEQFPFISTLRRPFKIPSDENRNFVTSQNYFFIGR